MVENRGGKAFASLCGRHRHDLLTSQRVTVVFFFFSNFLFYSTIPITPPYTISAYMPMKTIDRLDSVLGPEKIYLSYDSTNFQSPYATVASLCARYVPSREK